MRPRLGPAQAIPRALRARGQALLEFSMILVTMLLLMMGVVEFARLFQTRLVITSLSREGSNLAARGIALTNVCDTLVVSAQPLNINASGYVILSDIMRKADGTLLITNQVTRGGVTNYTSKIGVKNATGSAVHLPVTDLPAVSQHLMATEVYYQFSPCTPIGAFLTNAMPTLLYDVTFF
jgi:Flp pilus assembly protein TadG